MNEKEHVSSEGNIHGDEWLKIVNLKKTYGDFVAVENINLDIRQGEFLTFLGGSGSGKTTTLLSIAGFLEPSAGEILLSGASILDKPPHKRNIGMVFQQYSLFPHMSIFENVAFPLKMRKVGKDEIKKRVTDILTLVELEEFADRMPAQLSGGQQQRVALARALVFEPTILLMDEPLAALDKQLRETMQMEIRQLHEQLGLTIIYVTHDQEEALKMSDRIAIFNEGNIDQIGTPTDLYDRPGTQFIAEFLGDSNVFHGKVTSLNNELVTVESEHGQSFSAATDESYEKGTDVVIMVRPEKVQITKEIDHTKTVNVVQAKVKESIYLGESFKYMLETSFGETVTVKKQIDKIAEQIFENGDTVYMTWEAANAVVLLSNGKN